MNEAARDQLSFRPPAWRPWSYAAGALVALGLAVTSAAGPVALGSGIAFIVIAGVLLVLTGLDLWYGTPLVADQEGLLLGTAPRRNERIRWSDVERIEATTTSRGLVRLASLEIDLGDRLVVLSRHRLGVDPEAVADELRRRWRSAPRPR
ncbi:MAG TPA: PH domain-containing protein [Frankiaceae bacterium]|nr:PH domain-containing protein [Frankiaceae bacterium]